MNFYQEFHLNPEDDCAALGVKLATKELELQRLGTPDESLALRRVRLAYGVLAHETQRRAYDDALASGRVPGDNELHHLANFGAWPVLADPVPPANPFADPFPRAPQYLPTPIAPAPVRANEDARLGMTLLDGFLALSLVSMIGEGLGGAEWVHALVSGLMIIVYYVAAEVAFGGTPAKLMFGYQVRDVTTGNKLTVEQSVKRNWWRLVAIIPGIGHLISFVAAVAYYSTINASTHWRGTHDRIANAEVRKNRSSQ